MLTLDALLALLGPERRPVADLWRALGVERKALQAWLAAHRDELASVGVQLHSATASQARAPRLHIEIDGRRVAALSLPAPIVALAVVAPAPLAPANLASAASAADSAAAAGALERYRAGLAAQTRRAQDADLKRWAGYLTAVGVAGADCKWAEEPKCWGAVSWGLVEAFIAWQQAEGYATGTIVRALSTVKAYARQAARAGALAPDAERLISTVKAPAPRSRTARNTDAQRETARRPSAHRGDAKKRTPTLITQVQASRLKREHPDTPQGRRDALLLCLLIDHGLRVSEVADLQVTDLDLARGELSFYRRKVNRRDAHKLEPDTLRAAKRYYDAGDAPAAGPLLRASTHNGALTHGGMSTSAIGYRVAAAGQAIGVAHLSPHDLRHYGATVRARRGVPVEALMRWGGWAKPDTAIGYVEAARLANAGAYLGDNEGSDDHAA